MEKHKKYRFHLLGLVHLPTSEDYSACAFSQKNVKMCKMLLALGHEVYLYGAEGSTAPCTKFIQTHTLKEIIDTWGEGDNRFEIGYNWKEKQFKHDFNSKQEAVTMKYYSETIKAINKIKKPDDFLMITQGYYQKPIDDAVGLYLTIESGIGYRGSYCKFRSFESTYIQNFTYGSQHPFKAISGNHYDRVMPNYFDTKDFPFVEKKGDYLLFMGRMIQRKGVQIAIQTADAAGMPLKLAGQLSNELNLNVLSDNCEYVGYADAKKRAELMGGAIATLCPTTYLEPFCGVHVESMLCGTPVITTNFGVFPDTVIEGVNGYRCDVLQDFVNAVKKVDEIDRNKVREIAEQYTMAEVGKLYQKWFVDLHQQWQSSTDSNIKGWHYIEQDK